MNQFILERVAKSAVRMETIMDYLDMAARNIRLSSMNQALLFFQNPKAVQVCGKAAWEAIGGSVREDAVPIILYVPRIQKTGDGIYEVSYDAVNVYDISAVTGIGNMDDSKPNDISERILAVSGATMETIEKEVIRNPLDRGFYDEALNTIFVEKGMSREEQEAALVSIFTGIMFGRYRISDRILETAVRHVLLKRYGLKSRIESALFTKLDTYEPEQQRSFLMGLNTLSTELAQLIEGRRLTFEETAYVNCLLTSESKGDVVAGYMEASCAAGDELLSEGLRSFGEKLLYADEGCIKDLFRKRKERGLLSYPEERLLIDEEQYMKAKGNCLAARSIYC